MNTGQVRTDEWKQREVRTDQRIRYSLQRVPSKIEKVVDVGNRLLDLSGNGGRYQQCIIRGFWLRRHRWRCYLTGLLQVGKVEDHHQVSLVRRQIGNILPP